MLAASLKQNSLISELCPFPQFIRLVYCNDIKIEWACDKENKLPEKINLAYKYITVKKRMHQNMNAL